MASGNPGKTVIDAFNASISGKEVVIMMKENHNQCIHCSVASCKHLNESKKVCSLDSITVAPKPMSHSGDPADESMCQSYHKR